MFCPKCGTANAADSSFCASCGAALPTVQSVATATPSPPPSATVTRHYYYAGFWARFLAMLLDSVIVSVLMFLAIIMVWPMTIVILICGNWLYHAFLESSPSQATFGKQILGLYVTDAYGERISFARATGRHFGKIISGLILWIGYLMVAFTERKQALHDMMADCLVLRR